MSRSIEKQITSCKIRLKMQCTTSPDGIPTCWGRMKARPFGLSPSELDAEFDQADPYLSGSTRCEAGIPPDYGRDERISLNIDSPGEWGMHTTSGC